MAQPEVERQTSEMIDIEPGLCHAVDKKIQNVKQENIKMRWNLVFLVFNFIIIPLPLWIDCLNPTFAAIYGLFVALLGPGLLTHCAVRSIQASFLMKRVVDEKWEDKIPRKTEEERRKADNLQHVVTMCGYKEPIEVMCQSIDSLVSQSGDVAKRRLIVVIGLEKKTADVDEKAVSLKERYGNCFKRFHVTIHPDKWAGPREIRGKCSNANYTMRAAVTSLEQRGELDLSCTTATTCDTDTIFPPHYFANLGYQFLSCPKAKEVVWQAPLCYNHSLNKRPFYVRDIGIMRMAYMLGFLIPFNINTMSVFSFSLDLCIKADYFHAHYQMDDIIYTLTCMKALQKPIEILMIPMPVISGPTSGGNQWTEFTEWFTQIERWTIGACEVFHYFMVKRRRYNCSAFLSYGTGFVLYYGFILCSLTLTGLAGFINYALIEVKRDAIQQMVGQGAMATMMTDAWHRGIMISGLMSLAWTYLIFLTFFYIDKEVCKLIYHLKMKTQGSEDTTFSQNLMHWILMWPSLVMYSMVSYWAILKVAIYGKTVCVHNPSEKSELAAEATVCAMSESKDSAETTSSPSGGDISEDMSSSG